jgi:nitroalkane oxidase
MLVGWRPSEVFGRTSTSAHYRRTKVRRCRIHVKANGQRSLSRMIAAGFLRKCIPLAAGGESAGLIDTAIMVEELYAVNASVTLTLIGTLLGLLPLLIGGFQRQKDRLLPPFLKEAGAPLAGFCATEPGGSANPSSPPPGEGVRTMAALRGDR